MGCLGMQYRPLCSPSSGSFVTRSTTGSASRPIFFTHSSPSFYVRSPLFLSFLRRPPPTYRHVVALARTINDLSMHCVSLPIVCLSPMHFVSAHEESRRFAIYLVSRAEPFCREAIVSFERGRPQTASLSKPSQCAIDFEAVPDHGLSRKPLRASVQVGAGFLRHTPWACWRINRPRAPCPSSRQPERQAGCAWTEDNFISPAI